MRFQEVGAGFGPAAYSLGDGGKRNYRPEIDGLRAVAVLPVILFHAGFGLFGGGFVGVDVFFVISGYLITSIILREMEAGSFSLRHFYERRARRILPALTLVVIVCVPIAWITLLPDDMEDFLGSIIAICFFVSNFFFIKESDYFAQGDVDPLIHTWSLAVEEQFYLLFPLFMLFFWARGRRPVQLVLMVVFAASLALAQWGAYAHPKATFYLLPMRAWELALGAMLALYLRDRAGTGPGIQTRQLLSLTGLSLIAFAVFAYDKTTPFPSLYGLVPTLGAALIIAFATPGTFVGALLSSRLLVGIGLISYSAYLWHQPIFVFWNYVNLDAPSDGTMLLLSAVALLLAWLTWRFVELPFRRPGQVGFRALAVSAVGTGTFLLAFSLAGYATDGFDGARFTEAQRDLLKSAAFSERGRKCKTEDEEGVEESCTYFVSDPSWAVLGNSHGFELSSTLAEHLRDYGDGIRQLTSVGCRPLLENPEDDDGRCTRWMARALDFILHDKSLRNVVLSFRTVTDYSSRRQPTPADEKKGAWAAESYLAVVRRLAEAGKRVFLVLQAPLPEKDVSRYIWAVYADGGTDFVAGVSRERWNRSIAPLRDRLNELPADVVVVDPADLFCNRETCAAVIKGKALYYDDDHMSVNGADLVAGEIMRRASLLPPVPESPQS